MAEVTREHLIAAHHVVEALQLVPRTSIEQVDSKDTIAQVIADAEQRGYERGLANRDERCLQSDAQRIRERLAAEKAWDEGYRAGAADQTPKQKFNAFCCPNPYRLPKGPTK